MKILKLILLVSFLFGCEDLITENPEITNIYASRNNIAINDTTKISVYATDKKDKNLSYFWSKEDGFFVSETDESEVVWQAPSQGGNYEITATVKNDSDKKARKTITITVISNDTPQINFLKPQNEEFISSALETYEIKTKASHPNGIANIEIFVNGQKITTCFGENCSFNWNVKGLNGAFELEAKAKSNSAEAPVGIRKITVSVEGTTEIDG